jgi:ribosomal subunit interface protein
MKIDIRTHGFALTDAIRDHIERRLRFALARASAHIRLVAVHLSDIDGPRGGIEKRCRLRVRLKQSGDVMIDDTESDLCAAIDRAANRAGRTVARRVARRDAAADLVIKTD